MSATEEREIEAVSGTIKGVIVKGVDKWQVEVQPEGSNYTKKLWTKDSELVAAIPAKIGQNGIFVCSASYWTNNDGKQVRSLWIQEPGEDGDGNAPYANASPKSVPQAAATPTHATGGNVNRGDAMTKEEWARKDSAAHKRACIAIAVSALNHTMPSDPSADDLSKFLGRVTTLSGAWHRSVLAERDDPTGEDVPF